MENQRILTAIQAGDYAAVEDVLAGGYFIETIVDLGLREQQSDGTVLVSELSGTALHFAVWFNQPEIVRLLVKYGADLEAEFHEAWHAETPLGKVLGEPKMHSIRTGGIALERNHRNMTMLLNQLRHQMKALREAVLRGTAADIEANLVEGMPADFTMQWTDRYVNDEGVPEQMSFTGTALHYAVAKGDLSKIQVLIKHGASIGNLLSIYTVQEDLITGRKNLNPRSLTTSTITLAEKTGNPVIMELIGAATTVD